MRDCSLDSVSFLRPFNRTENSSTGAILRSSLSSRDFTHKTSTVPTGHQLAKIEIPASVEVITDQALSGCKSLCEVIFAPGSRLKEISGFGWYDSLKEMEIPPSVEIIKGQAFCWCKSLCEMILTPESHLKSLDAFQFCVSLPRISIPTYLECTVNSFTHYTQLCEAVVEFESRLDDFWGVSQFRSLKRVEVQENCDRLNEKHPRDFRGFLLHRRLTDDDKWSLLLRDSNDCYFIDESIANFARIPEIIIDHDQSFEISIISDRLLFLCARRSIPIPPFIRAIGSSFHSIDDCVTRLAIPASIRILECFLQVKSHEVVTIESVSNVREIRGFSCCKSLSRIEFPSSIEMIEGLNSFDSLQEVVFENESRVRIINGFRYWISLREIEIPASVEIVKDFDRYGTMERFHFDANSESRKIHGFTHFCSLSELEIPASIEVIEGFNECNRLLTVSFAMGSRVQIVRAFSHCISLCRINIPASGEEISHFEFSGLCQLVLAEGTQIRKINTKPNELLLSWNNKDYDCLFIVYQDSDLVHCRRCVHMNCSTKIGE
jgi:hypothetical protein